MKKRSSIFRWLIMLTVALCWCAGQASAWENAYQQKRDKAMQHLQDADRCTTGSGPDLLAC